MPERVYAVLLHVPETHLTTVLDVVRVPTVLVSVTPTEETRSSTVSSKRSSKGFHYANGKRDKGISGVDLAAKFAKELNRPFSTAEIKHAFVSHGFAESSYSPCLHQLMKEGKVRPLADGKYVAVGVALRLGG